MTYDPKNGAITLYVLGEDAKTAHPIVAKTLKVQAKIEDDDDFIEVTLQPIPLEGEPKDHAALLRLAAVRIRDSDVVIFVDRPAIDYGDYVWKEVLIAKAKGVPLVVLPDPTGRGPSGLLDEFNVPFTEADWTPEDIAEAIDEAVQ